jgi:hypothetical protein
MSRGRFRASPDFFSAHIPTTFFPACKFPCNIGCRGCNDSYRGCNLRYRGVELLPLQSTLRGTQ